MLLHAPVLCCIFLFLVFEARPMSMRPLLLLPPLHHHDHDGVERYVGCDDVRLCSHAGTCLRIAYVCIVSLLAASLVSRLLQFCGHLNKMCVSCVRFSMIISLNWITRAKVHSFSPRSCHRNLLFGWKIWNQIYSTRNFCTTHSQTDEKKNKYSAHTLKHTRTRSRTANEYEIYYLWLLFFCDFSLLPLLRFFSSFCCNSIFAFASDKQNKHRGGLMRDLMRISNWYFEVLLFVFIVH